MQVFKRICGSTNTRSRAFFNGFAALVLLIFVYDHKNLLRSPFLGRTPSVFVHNWDLDRSFQDRIGLSELIQGRSVEEVGRNMSNDGKKNDGLLKDRDMILVDPNVCAEFYEHEGYQSRCDYLITHPECTSGGFLDYMKFFYCDCKKYSVLGYAVLAGWLVALFYLLGNTASDYFCCSLEKLSDLLKLSPTVAGVSLLPLGNGAPDVFSGIAAFVGAGTSEVGLNSVLGGAVFVVSIVVGVVSLCIAKKRIQIDRKCFIRDLCFFLFAVLSLALILIIGKVTIGGAIAFLSIYILYGFYVAINEILKEKDHNLRLDAISPLLPVPGGFVPPKSEDDSVFSSLANANLLKDDLPHHFPRLPHWLWVSNVAIYSDYSANMEDSQQPLWGWSSEGTISNHSWFSCSTILWLLEKPLTIPRRLTIPIVDEERWSKGYAVASASLAPVLLAVLSSTQENMGALSGRIANFIGVTAGCILGILAFMCTKSDHPPRKFLFPWVFGGFFMSIVWFYIIANELITLLLSFGVIMGINPSILALTILAWGNSVGDLMANTTLAMNEQNGVQIAMSGCYAGPMFNLLVGMGIPLLLGAWFERPQSYIVPQNISVYYTMGFLVIALIFSLAVLPQSDMRPNRILGVGLITIYLVFLSFQVGTAMGAISLHGHT